MNKLTDCKIGNITYHLLHNVAAMYDIRDAVGDGNIIETIKPDTGAAFDALCKTFAIMADAGELERRRAGYDKGIIPTSDSIRESIMPYEITEAKLRVAQAIMVSYQREINEQDGEVDIGLQELEQAKKKR